MTTDILTHALAAAQDYRAAAHARLCARLAGSDMDREQRAAHGFAWLATSVAALEALHQWIEASGPENPIDEKVARLGFAETLAQLVGGLPMGQNEFFRPADLDLQDAARTLAGIRTMPLRAPKSPSPSPMDNGRQTASTTPNSTPSVTSSAGSQMRRFCRTRTNGTSPMT
jgi:hypothetical protein